MKPTYLKGELICLRAMEPEDLDVIYQMENDAQDWDVANFTAPYSRYALKQYIENTLCDVFADRQLRLMVVCRTSGTVVGTVDVTDFVPLHARGEVGIAIRREYRRSGYGREALTLLCDYVFGFLRLKQLTAHIAVDNETSLHLFESCGFVRCGLLRAWWNVGGAFKDVVLLQRLRLE